MAVTIRVPGLTCRHAVRAVSARLRDVPGVQSVQVSAPIFGVPLTIFDYSSQVFPPLLMAAVLGLLYKYLRKAIPENIQLIFVPFFAMYKQDFLADSRQRHLARLGAVRVLHVMWTSRN